MLPTHYLKFFIITSEPYRARLVVLGLVYKFGINHNMAKWSFSPINNCLLEACY